MALGWDERILIGFGLWLAYMALREAGRAIDHLATIAAAAHGMRQRLENLETHLYTLGNEVSKLSDPLAKPQRDPKI